MSDKQEQKVTKGTTMKALLISAFIAAVPGVYSAWETASNAAKARKNAIMVTTEKKVRDTQERDLQQYAKVNQSEILALKSSCVTHKQLLDYMIKLGQEMDRKIASKHDSSHKMFGQPRGDVYWKKRYARLRSRILRANRRRRYARKLKLPKLRAARQVRAKQTQKPRVRPSAKK